MYIGTVVNGCFRLGTLCLQRRDDSFFHLQVLFGNVQSKKPLFLLYRAYTERPSGNYAEAVVRIARLGSQCTTKKDKDAYWMLTVFEDIASLRILLL